MNLQASQTFTNAAGWTVRSGQIPTGISGSVTGTVSTSPNFPGGDYTINHWNGVDSPPGYHFPVKSQDGGKKWVPTSFTAPAESSRILGRTRGGREIAFDVFIVNSQERVQQFDGKLPQVLLKPVAGKEGIPGDSGTILLDSNNKPVCAYGGDFGASIPTASGDRVNFTGQSCAYTDMRP